MYYFAYGSNLSLEHMRRLCGWHFQVIGPAVLEGYEFSPDSRGYATITPKTGSKTWGVLYDADQFCIDALDDFEGYPEVFGRPEVEVIGEDGKKYKAWVYVGKALESGTRYIKEDYLRRAIAGAAENRLPEEWIKFLESFKEKQ
jgi:gamma-glutamylcyclotransferase (GGCT)/AIG2-like uncharacterized protein YtfP